MSKSAAETGPEPILDLAFGFWASQALLSAVELGVFRALSGGPLGLGELQEATGIQRGARDLFDVLVASDMLARDEDGRYSLTELTSLYLDETKPDTYLGGLLVMANRRLYPFWGHLADALRTGKPQNETRHGGDFFPTLYADPERLRGFLRSMTGRSMGAIRALVDAFPWKDYRSVADIGCAQGTLLAHLVKRHPHLTATGFDLPAVRAPFEEHARELGVPLTFTGGDFLAEPLPRTEVLIFGHILHDWDLDRKRELIAKAYDALPSGGAIIVYEALIDDERRTHAYGMLMSLNMAVETEGGFDFTGADCSGWLRDAGFVDTYVQTLTGHEGMVVGFKR
ncbi:Dimerisation domain-containing protein [Amycolatopsis xylanica]|uniref:Dimerisation domain-containing protein n=1 Tax=Amycolatopsis xylanica TaxID=589385 RepID=A0A1H2UG67_9PSEU|nr:methyltransferase [Amycolatopsis xylanica]SDW54524.1 Dimerisation domain-containing protein [Amycolatopsis xylanica]